MGFWVRSSGDQAQPFETAPFSTRRPAAAVTVARLGFLEDRVLARIAQGEAARGESVCVPLTGTWVTAVKHGAVSVLGWSRMIRLIEPHAPPVHPPTSSLPVSDRCEPLPLALICALGESGHSKASSTAASSSTPTADECSLAVQNGPSAQPDLSTECSEPYNSSKFAF